MDRPDINLFLKNVWFFVFYFILLLLIASFGTVAEASMPVHSTHHQGVAHGGSL